MSHEDKLILGFAVLLGFAAMVVDVACARPWNVEATIGMLMFLSGGYMFARG